MSRGWGSRRAASDRGKRGKGMANRGASRCDGPDVELVGGGDEGVDKLYDGHVQGDVVRGLALYPWRAAGWGDPVDSERLGHVSENVSPLAPSKSANRPLFTPCMRLKGISSPTWRRRTSGVKRKPPPVRARAREVMASSARLWPLGCTRHTAARRRRTCIVGGAAVTIQACPVRGRGRYQQGEREAAARQKGKVTARQSGRQERECEAPRE